MPTALPSEAEFLTMMSRRVDPETYAVYTENLELTPEMSWAVESFRSYLVYFQNGEDWGSRLPWSFADRWDGH